MKKAIAKKYLTKLLCALLTLCLMLTAALALSARAADGDAEENREFSERVFTEQFAASSGWPASPSNWTGEYIGQNGGNVVSGIIPLNSDYTANYDSFKLKNPNYPEYADKNNIPKTPFGGVNTEYTGTNRNVLMINTAESKTAYGYSYSATNLSANSYYRFSVYVKTGMFAQASGAAVTLTGLKDPVGIWNIDTVSKFPRDEKGAPILPNNNKSLYGWEEFKIYVATGPNSETATLKLSVGDHVGEHVYPSEGYAFFANITADKLSATNYFADIEYIQNDDNVCIYDMNPALNENTFKNGGFDPSLGGWKKAISEDEEESTNAMSWGYYNAGNKFIDNNTFGMKKDPFTPTGKFDEENCIMVLSSFYKVKDEDTNEFKGVQAGIVSDEFVIEQEKFYLLSFWYNTESITGGAAAVIKGQNTVYSQQNKLPPVSINDLTSNNNAERYGWQRGNFYIRGSLIMDRKLTLELWLGYESEASGIAMFDDITLTEIDYFEFTENSLGGQVVTIDSYAVGGTIANSVFSDVEYQRDEYGIKAETLTYPAKPSSWTFINTQTAGTAGDYSNQLIEIDDKFTAHGVVPTYEDHYNANRGNYLLIANPMPATTYANKNVLMLAAKKPTAFGYRSESFTVNVNQQYALKVNLDIKIDSGYGAALILKKDSGIVATIEGIKDTQGFCDYTFYLAGGSAQATLTLEIWLGMLDKNVNDSKLTTGHIFVNSVSLDEVFPGEDGTSIVETKSKDFINPVFNPTVSRFTMYCPGALDFSSYDRYSDQPVRDAYDMTLEKTGIAHAGILGFMPKNQVEVVDYDNIYAEHLRTEYRTDTLLYMRNVNAGYSKFQSNYSLNLNADTRYRIDFSILVDLYGAEDNNRAVGAGIWLDGSHAFKNIRSTYRTPYTTLDYDADGNPIYQKELEFKQFSFYYATGTDAESLKWYLTLGDTYSYQGIAGRLFVNSVVVTEIDSYAFEEIEKEQNDLDDDEKDPQILIFPNKGTVDPVETPVDDEGTDPVGTAPKANETPWYLIPSILLVAAMVIALGGVSIKRLRARSPRNRGREKVVSYDRRKTLNIKDDAPQSVAEGETPYASGDSTFDSFDDETAVVVEKKVKTVKTVKPADETVEGEEIVEEVVEVEAEADADGADADTKESVKPKVKEENEFDD